MKIEKRGNFSSKKYQEANLEEYIKDHLESPFGDDSDWAQLEHTRNVLSRFIAMMVEKDKISFGDLQSVFVDIGHRNDGVANA